jgi:arsenate reductase
MSDKERVLILCTGNSARSQMAEGLLRHDAVERFDVESAGTKPGIVRPEAIAAMKGTALRLRYYRVRQRPRNLPSVFRRGENTSP